mgnify:CR=1 FL=1
MVTVVEWETVPTGPENGRGVKTPPYDIKYKRNKIEREKMNKAQMYDFHDELLASLKKENETSAEMLTRWAIEDEIRRRELWG